MAKRKRLNKRVAVLLGAMGAVMVLLVLVLVLRKGGSLLDRFFPKDAARLLQQAKDAREGKRYEESAKAFEEAIRAARATNVQNMHEYYFEAAQLSKEWALAKGAGLTKTQVGELIGASVRQLKQSLNHRPDYLEARRFLCELFWQLATASRDRKRTLQALPEYVKEADDLLERDPNAHETWFRRGGAKAALSLGKESPMAKQSIADMRKAVAIKPEEGRYWSGLIAFLQRLGTREQEVEQAFQQAVAALPNDVRLRKQYVSFLRARGRMTDVEQQIQQAERIDRKEGKLLRADNRVLEAAKLRSQSVDPRSPDAEIVEQQKKQREEKLREALAIYKQVSDEDKLEARAYLRRANILSQEKQPAEAVAVLRQGLDALNEAVSTRPAGKDKNAIQVRTVQLNYAMANVLLDRIEAGDPNRGALLNEAEECLREMTLQLGEPQRAKVRGRIALAEGKYSEAIEQLEAARKQLPRFDVTVANLLINIYLRQDLPGKAEEILNDLLRIPGQQRNVGALLAKAQLLIRYRDYEGADRLITRALLFEPKNAEAMNLRMKVMAIRGETPALPPDMVPAPRTVQMLVDRATMMWLDGQRERAVQYIERLRARVPKNRTAIRMLFQMYRSLQREEDARRLLDEAVRLFPDDKILKVQTQVLQEPDRDKQYQMLIEAADEFAPFRRAVERANIALVAGKTDEHFRYLQEAAQIEPNAPQVIERLFGRAVEKKDWAQAEQYVAQAAQANLDGGKGMMFRTQLALAREDHDAAIASAMDLLKDQPNRKGARVLLGHAYRGKKLFDQAYEAFRTVHEDDPAYAPALMGLAAVTQDQGKIQEHADWVKKAYRFVPRNAYISQEYLKVMEDERKPDDVIPRREAQFRRNPDDLGNLLRLGALYERKERLQDAERMYVLLHEKSPDKTYSGRVLADFYRRTSRPADIERVLDPLLASAKDRVALRILYGQMIAPFDTKKAKSFLESAIAIDGEDPRGHLALARYWGLRREWTEAVAAMRNYIRLRPDDPSGRKELIRYFIEAGSVAEADKQLDKMLAADPTDATARTLKGLTALKQNDLKRAERLFTQAIQDNPNYAEPLIFRAQLHMARGAPSKARSDLEAAKRLSNRVDVAMQLGMLYRAMRDYDNAEFVFRELHGQQRDYIPAIEQLISLYSRRQKWNELEKLLADAKAALPGDARFFLREAGMWHARDRQDLKLAALAKAVDLAPNAVPTVQAYLRALQEAKQHSKVIIVGQPYLQKPVFAPWVAALLATSMAELQQPEPAEKLFVRSLESIRGEHALLLVRQLREAYDTDGTVQRLEKWIAPRATNWRPHLVLGLLYSEVEELQKAAGYLTAARDLADNKDAKFLAHRHLGSTLYRMKKFPEAEASYLAALKLEPRDVQVLNNIAYLYTNDLKNAAKALPYAERAARLWSSNARVLDTLGWTQAQLRRYPDAEVTLMRAVQLESPLTASRYHLGWVYEKTGRLDEAQKQYRQGFEMVRNEPGEALHGQLKAALERVEKLQAGSARPTKTGSGR